MGHHEPSGGRQYACATRKKSKMRSAVLSILASATMAMIAILPASGATAAATSASSAAQAVPRVLPCAGKPELKPANYLMSCADANASWKEVTWTSWGAKAATGTGKLYQNDCSPDCAAGHFHSYAAKLVLSDVVHTKKYGLLYATATFSYSVGGKHKSETFSLAT
jgi:hypothetical protein